MSSPIRMVQCPACGHTVAPDARACPQCGKQLGMSPAQQQSRTLLVVVVVALAAIGGYSGWANAGGGQGCSASPLRSSP